MALEDELSVVLLLLAVWITERGCRRVNASPIIGQIAAGLVVGPALLDVVPFVEAFRLLGKLGVMILVIESGLSVDLHHVRQFGVRASLAAATGVFLPTLLSFALYSGVLGAGWKTALAVGAALSPTSLGFSAQLLGEVGELTTPIGHLICTAAVIDDVLSLLLLAEVDALGEDDPNAYIYVVPVSASVGSVLVGSLATIFINSKTERLDAWVVSLNHPRRERISSLNFPETPEPGLVVSKNGEARAGTREESGMMPLDGVVPVGEAAAQPGVSDGSTRDGVGSVGLGDRALLAIVLAFSLLFAYLSALVGSSDLLGCFMAGLAFSGVPGVQRVWGRQMKRYSHWGARLFFSATVAFSVPSIYKDGGLLRVKPFWKGLILTAAAVVGKLAVGLFAGPPLTLSGFYKLGVAMNGRGEFSFFIAEAANEKGILTAEDYSAVVWALLLSSIAAPIAFRRVLAADRLAAAEADGAAAGRDRVVDAGEGRKDEISREGGGEAARAGFEA